MRAIISALLLAPALALGPLPATAEGVRRVESRDDFVRLVAERDLKRFGIRLNVSPGGEITGRAFGKPVTGQWRWAEGYFCRDLKFGQTDLGPNCQVVERRGGSLRFIADKGRGDHADLRLD